MAWRVDVLCQFCHADGLELLTEEPDDGYAFVDVQVSKCCRRCHSWAAALRQNFDSRFAPSHLRCRIYLPAQLVADATVLIKKYEAHIRWRDKPADLELQLANLVQGEKEPRRLFALQTAGIATLRYVHNARRTGCFPCFEPEYVPYWRFYKPARSTARAAGTPPVAPTSAGGHSKAEKAEIVDVQQRAFRDGEKLESTTVVNPGTAITSDKGSGSHEEVGKREAYARMPQVTEGQQYMFGNNPSNLESANTLRNVDVGDHKPTPAEKRRADKLVQLLCERVFTKKRCIDARVAMGSALKAFPKKYSTKTIEEAMKKVLSEARTDEGVPWDKHVKAFVKSEITAKPKPRPIANHGPERLAALAEVAWVFEHVLFDVFEVMSIKHLPKREAMDRIVSNLDGIREKGPWVENDLSAFEFGISCPIKTYESIILRQVADHLGVLDIGNASFERVVESRTRTCVWSMQYKDESGELASFKLRVPRVMRESGDRITSSGNFLQNLIAWISFLVDESSVESALDLAIRKKGRNWFYTSPRDGKKYLARLAFEGDDTLGRLGENIPITDIEEFFTRWGWKSKLKYVLDDGFVRFVGYDALIQEGSPVKDGDNYVMCPEIKRFLTTKSWTAMKLQDPDKFALCARMYAAHMADSFKHVEPLHAYCAAVHAAHGGKDVALDDNEKWLVRELAVQQTGEVAGDVSDALPGCEGGSLAWRRLAELSAGACSDLEWSTACGITDVRKHGADVAALLPSTWVS